MHLISKPTLLITDSYNFLYNQFKKRSRDERLLGKFSILNKNNVYLDQMAISIYMAL